MRRVALSVIAGEELQGLLADGADRQTNFVSALVDTVTRLVVQELLEGEQLIDHGVAQARGVGR